MSKARGFGEGRTGLPVEDADRGMVRWLLERDSVPVVRVDGRDTGDKVITRHLNAIGTPSLWHGLYVPKHAEGEGFRVVHAWSATTDYRHEAPSPGWFVGQAEYDVYPGEDGEVRIVDLFVDTGDGPDKGVKHLAVAHRHLHDLGHIATNPQDLLSGDPEVVQRTANRLPNDVIRAAAQFVIASS